MNELTLMMQVRELGERRNTIAGHEVAETNGSREILTQSSSSALNTPLPLPSHMVALPPPLPAFPGDMQGVPLPRTHHIPPPLNIGPLPAPTSYAAHQSSIENPTNNHRPSFSGQMHLNRQPQSHNTLHVIPSHRRNTSDPECPPVVGTAPIPSTLSNTVCLPQQQQQTPSIPSTPSTSGPPTAFVRAGASLPRNISGAPAGSGSSSSPRVSY